jgi:hypothetical protein
VDWNKSLWEGEFDFPPPSRTCIFSLHSEAYKVCVYPCAGSTWSFNYLININIHEKYKNNFIIGLPNKREHLEFYYFTKSIFLYGGA